MVPQRVYLTFVSLDEIAQYETLTGSELNVAKERLAYELTLMVHGEDEAKKAQEAARSLFSAQTDSENMPSTDFTFDGVDSISVADLLVHCKLAPSRSEAKRNITQGGVEVNDVKVTDFGAKVSAADFKDGKLIIKKGKKTYHRINLV